MEQTFKTMSKWSMKSWRQKLARQQPPYPCEEALSEVLEQISELPGLTHPDEIDNLLSDLKDVSLSI